MIKKQSKTERQKIGLNRWFNSSKHGSEVDQAGTLNYVTGFGKTKTAIDIVKEYLKRNPDETITVLVPREGLYYQWKGRLSQNLTNLDNVQVYTIQYAQYHRLKFRTGLLIVDEIHEFLSEDRLSFINGTRIYYESILGLTATFDDEQGRHLILKTFCPVIDVIYEDEAEENEWIARSKIYNIGVNLTPTEKFEYDAYSRSITNLVETFGEKGFQAALKCLSGGYASDGKFYKGFAFCRMWAKMNGWTPDEPDPFWNPNSIMRRAQDLMQATNARKELINNARGKIDLTIALCTKFKDEKVITFSESTAFAQKVHDKLIERHGEEHSVIYHSKMEKQPLKDAKTGEFIRYKSGARKGEIKLFGKTVLKKNALAAINDKANVINTAKSLDTGQDIPVLKIGIIASGTTSNQNKQRSGRVTRFTDGSSAMIINIYCKGTNEEKRLRYRQRKGNMLKVSWIEDIEYITLPEDLELSTLF